jgi:hypothetical protein
MLSSKVVVIAQLVMLGYSYADAEDSVDSVRVHDTELALEWLESRNARKTALHNGSSENARSQFKLGASAPQSANLYGAAEAPTSPPRLAAKSPDVAANRERTRHPRGPSFRKVRLAIRSSIRTRTSPPPPPLVTPNTGASTTRLTCTARANAR